METKDEILSTSKNTQYYIDKINDLAMKQFELIYNKADGKDYNPTSVERMFKYCGEIMNSCRWLSFYLQNIKLLIESYEKAELALEEKNWKDVEKIETVVDPLYNELNKALENGKELVGGSQNQDVSENQANIGL